ncbi:hypothetical protein L0F63_002510 [Massospora cicadina]|nr:hypothetical protein L0F63_002510 [Massospora cicadina]
MLARNHTAEIADLKFQLNSLTKKHEARLLESKLAASKTQEALEKKERKIEDLEKSLVFLNAREKEYELLIKELEEENKALDGFSMNRKQLQQAE